MDEKLEAFLKDYQEVVRKHGIRLGGCGCCGSPYPTPVEGEHGAGDDSIKAHIAHLRSEGL